MDKTGLIIGKFMPLHVGHEAMFKWALTECDKLMIIVLSHDTEPIAGDIRYTWVMYSDVVRDNKDRVVVHHYTYNPDELDSSSESNIASSYAWADALKAYIDCCDIIFGSEEYVRYMADYTYKEYKFYDVERTNINISATAIRENPIDNWSYLASVVKRTLSLSVCICGTESSGKTTLCNTTSTRNKNVTVLPELGRCLVGNSEYLDKDVLWDVLDMQAKLTYLSEKNPASPIVFWDTDCITTLSYMCYAGFIEKDKICTKNFPIADIYLFLERDFDFVQDGTRMSENSADELAKSHYDLYTNVFNIKNICVVKNNVALMHQIDKVIEEHKNYIKNVFKL